MKYPLLPLLALAPLVPALLLAACGDAPNNTSGSAGAGASASGGAGGQGNTGGAGNGTGQGGEGGLVFTTSSGAGGAGGDGGSAACVGQTVQAELVPLDLYIMLDSSGSMLEKSGAMGTGVAKWDAVKGALTAFVQDPGSAGIGVGLQYFPLQPPGVPDSCTSNNQCGQYGPCVLKTCSGLGSIVPCAGSQDCPNGSSCTNLGQCANDPATYCLPIGAFCNGNKGQCVQVQSSFCANQTSCNAADYAAPAVDIALLPGAAAGIVTSMNAKAPEGGTPTSAALQGAVDHARAHATANPTHTVVAVLATDGLPTQCDPLDFNGISAIAASALGGSPSVPTFVIGVFAGDDAAAKTNLDQLAQAGGTNQSFLVDVTQNVEQAFLAALNAIRGQKLACEYLLPPAPPGETLDYGKVNVRHTPTGSMTSSTIYYVQTLDKCDAATGGWYYDQDPSAGLTPTKIIMCPATCTVFGTGGQVDIGLGCTTEIPPPK
jgi:hypothetical protein